MAMWIHRRDLDAFGDEHVDDGNCFCIPIRINDPVEALQLARTIAYAALAMAQESRDDLGS